MEEIGVKEKKRGWGHSGGEENVRIETRSEGGMVIKIRGIKKK